MRRIPIKTGTQLIFPVLRIGDFFCIFLRYQIVVNCVFSYFNWVITQIRSLIKVLHVVDINASQTPLKHRSLQGIVVKPLHMQKMCHDFHGGLLQLFVQDFKPSSYFHITFKVLFRDTKSTNQLFKNALT